MASPLPPDVLAALDAFAHGGALDLPVLPGAVAELVAATGDESADVRRLSDLVERDQALAAHLLRLANSAEYAGRAPIVSLRQAVTRLGVSTLRQLALVMACEVRVFRSRAHEAEMKHLFRHALAAALFAREIARVRRSNVEEAFLAALLHDVGRALLVEPVARIAPAAPPDALAAWVDRAHADVGRRLAAHWRLSERVAESVAEHHRETAEIGSPCGHTVQLADRLAHLAADEGDETAVRAHPAVVALNLYPDAVDALIAKRASVAQVVERLA